MSTVIASSTAVTDASIKQAYDNANLKAKNKIIAVACSVAEKLPTLTSDDIRAAYESNPSLPWVRDWSVLGAIIRNMVRAGVLSGTGLFKESDRVSSHKRALRVFKSNTFVTA